MSKFLKFKERFVTFHKFWTAPRRPERFAPLFEGYQAVEFSCDPNRFEPHPTMLVKCCIQVLRKVLGGSLKIFAGFFELPDSWEEFGDVVPYFSFRFGVFDPGFGNRGFVRGTEFGEIDIFGPSGRMPEVQLDTTAPTVSCEVGTSTSE